MVIPAGIEAAITPWREPLYPFNYGTP